MNKTYGILALVAVMLASASPAAYALGFKRALIKIEEYPAGHAESTRFVSAPDFMYFNRTDQKLDALLTPQNEQVEDMVLALKQGQTYECSVKTGSHPTSLVSLSQGAFIHLYAIKDCELKGTSSSEETRPVRSQD